MCDEKREQISRGSIVRMDKWIVAFVVNRDV
jgi:hypothetical protein